MKYATKFSHHNRITIGCSVNFVTRVCDLICRGKTKVIRCGEGSGYVAGKHKSAIATKRKVAKRNAAKRKSLVAAKQVPVTATPRTPLNKGDCIDAAQAFYSRAQTLSRQKNQTIPREFELVVSKLDEFCGEEEFEKARISIDWMNSCLQKFTKDFCSRDRGYFCAIDPESEECLSRNSETQGKSSNSP
jgi:hypothetical protein